MAILDTEYVKAPSLLAGDLSIEKSSTGFSMSEGDTVFLTGATDGTLTIGKENLTSSIATLHINARRIYWNNKPLQNYWTESGGGGSGPAGPDLTQEVEELQELTAQNKQAIQEADERLSQGLSDLRMDALGAKINTLVSPINTSVSNICGIAIPVTLLKATLPYFNKITLNNVRSAGTGYLAIYYCDVTTPAVSSPCTLLYVSEEAFETTGSENSAPTSRAINIPEKITVPDSGLIILIFASSAAVPQADNISWVTGDNSTVNISMGTYSPGAVNRPYDTSGEYVLVKNASASSFLTYSPDIDFSYVYDDTIEVLSSQIEDLRSDLEDRMTYEETVEVVTSQIDELIVDLESYMTYDDTIEAITEFPDDGSESRLYNLGGLVDALTIPTQQLALIKKVNNNTSSIKFNGNILQLESVYIPDDSVTEHHTSVAELNLVSGIAHLEARETGIDSDIYEYSSIAELRLGSRIAHLAANQYMPSKGEFVDVACLSIRDAGYADYEAGAIELKSIYLSDIEGTSAQAHLITSPGRLELGIQDNGQDVFQLLAQAPSVEDSSPSTTGVHLIYRSPENATSRTQLNMNGNFAGLFAYNSSGSGRVIVETDNVIMSVGNILSFCTLTLDYSNGLLSLTSSSPATWDYNIDSTSSAIPTISIVHHLIQQALANQ